MYKINEDAQEEIQSETVTSAHYVGAHSRLVVDGKAKVLWLFWEVLAKVIVSLKKIKNKSWEVRFIKIHRLQVKDRTIDLVFLLAFLNTGP